MCFSENHLSLGEMKLTISLYEELTEQLREANKSIDLWKGLAIAFHSWTMTNHPEDDQEYHDDVREMQALIKSENIKDEKNDRPRG